MKQNEKRLLYGALAYLLTGVVFQLCLFLLKTFSQGVFRQTSLQNPFFVLLLWPLPFVQRLIDEGFMWYHLLCLIFFGVLLGLLAIRPDRKQEKKRRGKPSRR